MTDTSPRSTVLADGFAFPECPRWHGSDIWVSDMHTGEVSTVNPATGASHVAFSVPGSAAGLAWTEDGDPLAVSMTDRAVYRFHDGIVELFADLRPLSPSRGNELESDHRGGFFVSNVGFSLTKETPRPTRLGHLSADGTLTVVADDLVCPNGMALDSDATILLVAESYADRVTRFSIAEDGRLFGRRVVVQLDDGQHPDGLDLAPDGTVWVATMGSPIVRRFSPEGVELSRVIASQPAYACRVADDGRSVAICTSSGLDLASLDQRPGRVELFSIPEA